MAKRCRTYATNIFLGLSIALCILPGCKREGNVEKAGKKLDEAVDNVKEGENPLKDKGPAERAGESIDKAVEPDR